jgi:hypothetical protein
MDVLTIILRLLHIVLGALWVGFAIFVAFILMPSLTESGPAAGPVMAAIQRRGYVKIIAAVSGTTLLAGIWLFWRVSGGFRPDYMRSHMGIALSFGAAASIIGYAVGSIMIGPNMLRAAALGEGIGAITSDSERTATLARIGQLRARAAVGGKVTAILLLVAIAAMAVARYL